MKLLVDMNLSPRWVGAFEQAGFEAIHWSRVGPGNAADRIILDYAADNDFVVFTHDLDFGAILAATRGVRPSVIQIRAGEFTAETAGPLVVDAPIQTANELSAGALVTIDLGRARVRILPLSRG